MIRERAILHSDINCCYAQIECQEHPELRGRPIAVGGDEEARHGIVLARNLLAKRWGVATADTLVDARRKCPGLVVVPADYRLYMDVCGRARKIYYDYTNLVEPFGPDESWLDVTGSTRCLAMSPVAIAREISERMRAELGITVSVGVSWNKVFAKFGSDYMKPDAVTEITRENYADIVWNAPVRDLLYVGDATERKLKASGVVTIGDLAHCSDYYLSRRFGKMGLTLRAFARGEDASEVKALDAEKCDVEREAKSYGNSITFPRDIADDATAKAVTWMLAESVAQRMREGRARARAIAVGVRDAGTFRTFSRQRKMPCATNITFEIAQAAWALVREIWRFTEDFPARGISVRGENLVPAADALQMPLFDPEPRRTGLEAVDAAVDDLRRRFGNNCVVWGPKAWCADTLAADAKRDNTVHPVSFFHR